MWVTRVLGDCPTCHGKSAYGNISVQRDHVLRGCTTCGYQAIEWLPEIRKKVLYLDQFFFSHAFRGREEQFLTAIERVKRACHFQLVVAPYSSVHEDETHQWRGYKDMTSMQLMEFIKVIARGAEFERDYVVEQTQVLKAFEAFLKDSPPEYVIENDDAIRGVLDEWDDYYFVDVGGYWRDIEAKRRLKVQTVDELVKVFDAWQQSAQTFDDAVALEYHDAGRLYLEFYLDKLNRIRQGDPSALVDAPITASMVEYMREYLPKDMPELEQIQRCANFFRSEHFTNVPHQWISARMFAALKDMVKRGAYANRVKAQKRLSGLFEDMAHISLYAPYCDAFVMDTPMAELVRQPTVGLESRYGVRVFSLNNWDELLAWLDELESGMSPKHRAGIETAYPARPPDER
jgi:hypothetical protein